MAAVTLENVNKIFDNDFHAVHDVNLEIADGEFMVLVGPSGCAKSTTLNMIAGLEEISSGEIRIGDTLVNDLPPKDRDIAMVFQNYALYPHMNVYQNMAFGLKLRKTARKEIDRRVREAARILDLEPLLKRKPKELSGGQRQRVAVGRAIVRQPKVFLLDEPLSNLDAKLRVHMRLELAKLHKQLATTIIYVTHDQVEAMTMGERITVMKEGVVQQVGTPMNIYRSPVNRFVATFIGSPTMNVLPAVFKKRQDSPILQITDGPALPLPQALAQRLDIKDETKVLIGIRPENFQMEPGQITNPESIETTADIIEQMGSEVHVHFKLADISCTARLPAESDLADTDRLKLYIDMEKCHVFDAQTEKNLLL